MKKIMTKLVALLAVLTLLMSMSAVSIADEAHGTATAWLLYFANPGWWPQHKTVDQPASETGVEATNAVITGPGNYTVGLKFNWQTAESAMQFNLVLDNAEVAFPGCYVDITDIRVNGESIAMKADNMYGTFHDDPESGFAPIYNTYWDATHADGAGSTGPDPATMRAFDGALDTESYEIINPADIKAGTTIEVDFVFAAEAGAAPEDIGAMPKVENLLIPEPEVVVPENTTTAHLYYQAGGWWPETNGTLGQSTTALITGEGHYTLSAYFTDQGGWTPTGNGAEKLILVVDDPAGSTMDGMYLGISDVRVNGTSISVGDVAYGPTGYDSGNANMFDANDGYAILYDKWMVENQPGTTPWGHETWNGKDGTTAAIDPSDLANVKRVEVDFFVTATQNLVPSEDNGPRIVWYPSNTVGLAGLSLSDLGIADDWHNIVPVDLTKTAWYTYPLVGADAHQIGTAVVAVNNGNVSVQFVYAKGMIYEESQCIKWFTDLADITPEALASTEGGLTDAEFVTVAGDLGGADVAYLSINNKVTWRNIVTIWGQTLPRYYRNMDQWVQYRAELADMIPAVEPAPSITSDDVVAE